MLRRSLATFALLLATVGALLAAEPKDRRTKVLDDKDTFAKNNLLTRGQEVAVEVSGRDAVDLTLQPGEMSLHHVRIVHGSEPNRAHYRRLGLAIRYVPTYVRQTEGPRDYATLVRGVDRYHHFEPEPVPKVDFGEQERADHKRITEEAEKILYRGTDRIKG